MNQFNLISTILKEATGEYPELDETVKSFWKSTIARFKQKTFYKLKEYKKESKMMNEIIDGPKIVVRAIPGSERNAMVIPGTAPGDISNWFKEQRKWIKKHKISYLDAPPPMCFMMINAIDRLKKMRKYKIKSAKNGKKKIEFSNFDPDFVVTIFATYGFLTNLSKESRIAVYLHELGHWVDAAQKIPMHILKNPKEEKIYYAYQALAERSSTRYQELEADDFAKQLGYGKELIKAFDELIDKRKNVHFMAKIMDKMMKAAVKADNKMEEQHKKWRTDEYPSMNTRKAYLRQKD